MSKSLAKARLVVSLGALSAILCACGGGGGGGGSSASTAAAPTAASAATPASSPSTTVSTSLHGTQSAPVVSGGFSLLAAPGAAAAQTALTGDIVADSLIQLNNYRAVVGLPALEANSGIAQAAANHARYNHLNQAALHTEVAGNPGYTGVSFLDRVNQYVAANWVGEVAVSFTNGFSSSSQPMDVLFAAPFHRAILLYDFAQAGVGYVAPDSTSSIGNMVMDTAIDKGFITPSQLVAYPYSGQADAQTSWFAEESPNPFWKTTQYANTTVGYPVTLVAESNSTFSNVAFTITDPDGANVACEESDDSNNTEAKSLAMCAPYAQLTPNTVYTVKVSGTLTREAVAQPFSAQWTFATTPAISSVARQALSAAAAQPSLSGSPATLKKTAN